MIKFDDYANENETKHNSKEPYIPDQPYRVLIIAGFGSGKTNALKYICVQKVHKKQNIKLWFIKEKVQD